jgi:signal transduction histidine kinase
MSRVFLAIALAAVLAGCAAQGRRAGAPPTRAEVVAFVDAAAEYARAMGREKALAEFGKRDGNFCKGELYIYAYDLKGICLAHPVMPARVGRDGSGDRDTHGVSIHQECLRLFALGDTGWVRCTWLNPASGALEPKALYVMKIAPDWYIGSGTYGPEAREVEAAQPTRAEVVAFVNAAADYARAAGKEKALTEFNNPKGAFVRGSLYIYAYDMKGICLAHGLFPERTGRDCSKDRDSHGVAMQDECLKLLAGSDTAWVKCAGMNPLTKQVEPKAIYIVKMAPDWYLGSGTYGPEAEK